MSRTVWKYIHGKSVIMPTFALALMISLASCNKMQKVSADNGESATSGKTATTETTAQKTFQSPEDAANALMEAAKTGDQGALIAIFGPDATQIIFTGNSAKDKDNLQDFVAAYNQMHRWGKIKAGGEVLQVGADNYVFPVPLAQNESGQWYFDTAAAKDEILARRIGRDERTAIDASQAVADAEHRYFDRVRNHGDLRQYTQKFASDPGQQNGLYWPSSEGQPQSPLTSMGDFAKAMAADSSSGPKQYSGYYYRILTSQGDKAKGGAKDYVVDGKMTRGFAVLAYPVEYRNSGIMSFLVGLDGVVYEKDLGEQTGNVAASITDYNPGDGWNPVTTRLSVPHNKS